MLECGDLGKTQQNWLSWRGQEQRAREQAAQREKDARRATVARFAPSWAGRAVPIPDTCCWACLPMKCCCCRSQEESKLHACCCPGRFDLQAEPAVSRVKGRGQALPAVMPHAAADGARKKTERYLDGRLVSTRGEKFIVETVGEEWDGGSKGKVITKGKRGKGFA